MKHRFIAPAALFLLMPRPVPASSPPGHTLTVPTTLGQSVIVEWTGTVPPGAIGAANTCVTDLVLADSHLVDLIVPVGAYTGIQVTAGFHVEWDDGAQDLVLTVLYDGSTEIGSSDGGTPQENVVATDPAGGGYSVIVCAFLATAPTSYRGRLTLNAPERSLNPAAGTGNASGLPPRFQNYAPDYPAQGFGMFGGEATLDVNTRTGSIFYMGFL